MQGLDKLIVYNIVSELRKLTRNYGLWIGGGGVSEEKRIMGNKQNKILINSLKQFDKEISENFGNLTSTHCKSYTNLTKSIQNLSAII